MIEITPQQLKEKLSSGERLVILDVREPWEYEISHIKSSINIPVSNFTHSSFAPDVPKDATIVTICEHGIRSLFAANALVKRGYKAYSMEGGMVEWNGPIEE